MFVSQVRVMQLSDALVMARSGRALAFLGSGFSLGAVSIANDSIPTSGELAKRLMKAAGESEDAEFDLAADLFIKAHPQNPVALNTFLQNQFTIKTISPAQDAFAQYPWQRIYTTNYDDIVEVRVGPPWRWVYSCVLAVPAKSLQSRGKMVGTSSRLRRRHRQGRCEEPLPSRSSKLHRPRTPQDAVADSVAGRSGEAAAIFAMGFSFADLHIARLFRQSTSLKRKTFVVVRPTATAAVRSYAAEFGTVVDCKFEALLGKLDKALALDNHPDVPILSFIEHPLPETPQEPKSEDIFNLLLAGTFNPANHLYALINPEKPYSFSRNYVLREIANWTGTARKFLISSRIGNGKSIFFRQLMVQLARDNFIVCEGRHAVDSLAEELEILQRRGQPLAFLYEGVRENEASIKAVAAVLAPSDILLVATRPTSFAMNYDNLRNVLGEGFKSISLDTLQPVEISSLDNVLNFYGLWAGVAGPTSSARAHFVRDECASEPRAVLLHLFRSPALTARIKEPVLRLVELGGDFCKVFAALLVIRLADCPIGFEDICDLFDAIPSEIHDHFRTAGVQDLFPRQRSGFPSRSPILSEYLLSELVPPAISASAMRLLVERLVDFRDADWRFEE